MSQYVNQCHIVLKIWNWRENNVLKEQMSKCDILKKEIVVLWVHFIEFYSQFISLILKIISPLGDLSEILN